MNSTFRIVALSVIAATTILAGCAKETDNGGFKRETALSLGTVTTERMLTRSVITGTTFPSDEAAKGIGLFLTATDGGNYDGQTSGYSNIKYSNGGSGWASDSPIMLSATKGSLYGYFPYSSSVTDLTAVPVESSLNGTDYMYAVPVTNVSKASTSVSLTMKHALARVSVKFVKDVSYTGAGSLTAFSLESKGLSSSGKMNIKTGVVTPDGVNSVPYSATETITTSGIIEECLLVPTSDTDRSLTLKCTIDGREYSLDFDGADTLCIRSSINSTITATLKNTGLSISDMGIGDWRAEIELEGEHKVTVEYSNDAGIADDVFLDVTSDGSSVTIKTHAALTGRFAQCTCTPEGKSICNSSIDETTGICTFTISNVQENIIVKIGYFMCNVRINFDSSKGSIKLNGNPLTSGSDVSVYAKMYELDSENATEFRLFRWSDAGKSREVSRSRSFNLAVKSDTTLTAEFCYADAIPGLFGIADNRKVFFSKGNLWCDGTGIGYSDNDPVVSSWDFETKQYESQPESSANRILCHISHFMWCKSASESVKLQYEEILSGTSPDDVFFTDTPDFTVNGVSAWRSLKTEEWQYLLGSNATRINRKKHGVTVCEKGNCIVLVPDDWDLNTTPIKNSYNTTEWAEAQAAGAVCLPATGTRDGLYGRTSVNAVNSNGYYWSGSPDDGYDSYCLSFSSSNDTPDYCRKRTYAYSVRLVADFEE